MAFSFTVGRMDEHGRTTEITVRSDYNYVIMENMDNTEHSENRILLTSETTVFTILQHLQCTSRRNKIASITFLNEVTKNEVTKNEVTKNEVTKNEVTKNEVTKNEVTKNEVTKNEVTPKDDDEHDWSDMDDILKMHPSMINGRFTVTIQNKVSPPRPDATYMELLDHNGKSYIRDYRNHVWEWIPFKGAGAWCGVYDSYTDTISVEN